MLLTIYLKAAEAVLEASVGEVLTMKKQTKPRMDKSSVY